MATSFKRKKRPFSVIMVFHYLKLAFRSLLFLCALAVYVIGHCKGMQAPLSRFRDMPVLLTLIWAVFIFEMILRFFPSRVESMGCQKQFRRNYIPRSGCHEKPELVSWKRPFLSAAAWLALNGVFAVLYMTGVFDSGIMLLIALAYSVCDMVCILFFCPFQTWFLKNKCCGTCRIYNWDYAMMFTPLLFVPTVYSQSLVMASLLLLLRWEVTYRKSPERFAENTNVSLECRNCREKLCHHKTQLQSFWRENKIRLRFTDKKD